MDFLQFFSSLVGSLAWPVCAVLIVCVFKKSIVNRFPDLSKLTLPGGISAEFGRELREVEATAPALVQASLDEPSNAALDTGQALDERVDSLSYDASPMPTTPSIRQDRAEYGSSSNDNFTALRANPTGVVMESWKVLESAIRGLAARPTVTENGRIRRLGILQILQTLSDTGTLQSAEVDVIKRLLQMRNLAAHSDQKIPPEDARHFQMIALSLANTLRSRGQE